MSIAPVSLLLALLASLADSFYTMYRYSARHFNVEYSMLLSGKTKVAVVTVSCSGEGPQFGPIGLTVSGFFSIAKTTKNPGPYGTYHVTKKDKLRNFNAKIVDSCNKNIVAHDFDDVLINDYELIVTVENITRVFTEEAAY
ncbi:hypothetical protein FOZ63_014045 [Perkinsus olseni]|uniref:Uncharacterized protein n=1 Tax=Perkinsus olseni TaxID=32597 RepID=A0A7J6NPD5_PEROL|nr:hypothetical protein FOZ60_006190 [Perkinsus olseni]KAF4745551.1 hypothetical protein FOZ63_014045 [Perkinsus olseni]